jgi:hypothetical protein
MRCFLVNVRENIIHTFDAVDASAARLILRQRVLEDKTNYALAVVIRVAQYVIPPPVPTVDDQAAP